VLAPPVNDEKILKTVDWEAQVLTAEEIEALIPPPPLEQGDTASEGSADPGDGLRDLVPSIFGKVNEEW
jgi:hypothetical protein